MIGHKYTMAFRTIQDWALLTGGATAIHLGWTLMREAIKPQPFHVQLALGMSGSFVFFMGHQLLYSIPLTF